MNETVWITGAAGFTGRHLLACLNSLPERPQIIGLDSAEQQPPGLDRFHQVDLTDSGALAALASADKPARVIHLAGLMPPEAEEKMWKANAGCTLGLLRGLAAAGCHHTRVLSIGSAAEYQPQPHVLTEESRCGGSSPYGAIKWAQTLLAIAAGRELGVPTLVARPFNLVGAGISPNLVLGWLCQQFSSKDTVEELVLGNLESARDFVDIRDAVAAYWLLVTRGTPGEIYNVCTGKATTIRELVALLCEVAGKNPLVRVDPARLKQSDPPAAIGSYKKIEQTTGWRPAIELKNSLAWIIRELQ